MKPQLLIVADDRERRSGVLERLEAMPDVALRIRRLKIGDYEVGGKVVVERKSLADFAASIIDGRLFRQASRLTEAVLRGAIIIEGRPQEAATLGIRREALQGALVSLSLIFDLPVLRTVDSAETARLLVYTADQLARVGTGNRTSGRRARSVNGRRMQLLRALPGIGTARAKVLLERFGSVEKCLSASVEELAAVEGVGRKTAAAIRSVVSETPAIYGRKRLSWYPSSSHSSIQR